MIRDAVEADVESITEILNALLDSTTIEYRTEPHTVEDRREWLAQKRAAALPVLVADDAGSVVGFASYGPFRDNDRWPGYRYTVEHSVHVAEAAWGAGVGRKLMDELIDRAVGRGLHAMIGAVDSANDGSVRFHERLGFVEEGRLREVGWKLDRWLDVVLMVRRF